jgi:hypothetical protein
LASRRTNYRRAFISLVLIDLADRIGEVEVLANGDDCGKTADYASLIRPTRSIRAHKAKLQPKAGALYGNSCFPKEKVRFLAQWEFPDEIYNDVTSLVSGTFLNTSPLSIKRR